jgi:hypothetical protein
MVTIEAESSDHIYVHGHEIGGGYREDLRIVIEAIEGPILLDMIIGWDDEWVYVKNTDRVNLREWGDSFLPEHRELYLEGDDLNQKAVTEVYSHPSDVDGDPRMRLLHRRTWSWEEKDEDELLPGMDHITKILGKGYYLCQGEDGPQIQHFQRRPESHDETIAKQTEDGGWVFVADDEDLVKPVRDGLHYVGELNDEETACDTTD